MPLTIELEIINLLEEVGQSDLVADRILQLVENNPDEYFNDQTLRELYSFLYIGEFYPTIIDFVSRHLHEKNFKVPWALMVECFAQCKGITDEARLVLWDCIKINKVEIEASIAPNALLLFPELKLYKDNISIFLKKKSNAMKMEMIDSLVSLRAQQLVDAERSLLTKMCRMFPNDSDVQQQLNLYKENHAYEILTRYSPDHRIASRDQIFLSLEHAFQSKEESTKPSFEQILTEMIRLSQEDSALAYEFAVALLTIEDYEGALRTLGYAADNENKKWLRIELLILRRHFLVVLEELVKLELELAHDPETFFATTYFRAQAYWGLGQKGNAIEAMESVISVRPNYRSALTLLDEWRSR